MTPRAVVLAGILVLLVGAMWGDDVAGGTDDRELVWLYCLYEAEDHGAAQACERRTAAENVRASTGEAARFARDWRKRDACGPAAGALCERWLAAQRGGGAAAGCEPAYSYGGSGDRCRPRVPS